nr:PAS domain-containing protein [Desulfobacteraceae bacterium]
MQFRRQSGRLGAKMMNDEYGNGNNMTENEEHRWRAEEMAEQKAAGLPEDIRNLPPEEIQQAFHQLQVHQIELEMQNDELMRVQAEIAASRAQYFDLYDLAPVGYFTISDSGLILKANLTGSDLLGLSRNSPIKPPVSRFILKEDQNIYYQHRKQLIDTGEPQSCELRIIKKDGTTFWAQLDAAIHETVGECAYRVVMSDITEHK